MKTIREARQDKDLDLFVNMVNNDPQHIARAKAKRDSSMRQQAEAPKPMEPETAALGVLSAVCVWCLSLVALV